jgi:hypothetical protein
MSMSEEQKSRIVSAVLGAASSYVMPIPSLVGDMAGVAAIDARKLQTAYGASNGAMGGLLASIPLVALAAYNKKLKVKGLKNAYKSFAKYVATPMAAGAGLGAYAWHGGPGISAQSERITRESKEQILRDASIRAMREEVKTSEEPNAFDIGMVGLATPASYLLPGVPVGSTTAALAAPRGKKIKAVGGYTGGRGLGMVPGYVAAAYLGRDYIKNPKKGFRALKKHTTAVRRVTKQAHPALKLPKMAGAIGKRIGKSPIITKALPLILAGESVGAMAGFTLATRDKKKPRKSRRRRIRRRYIEKDAAFTNLVKVIKSAKNKGAEVDPVKEKTIKKLNTLLRKDEKIQRSQGPRNGSQKIG